MIIKKRKERRERAIKKKVEVPITVYWSPDTHLNASFADVDPSTPGAIADPKYIYTVRQKFMHFVDKVNTDKPDVAIHIGDMIDGPDADNSLSMFMNMWNQISVPKHLIIGNHDLDNARKTKEQLAIATGYSTKPLIAGSRFNYSFVINKGGISAKFIMVDSTRYDDAKNGYTGYCPQPVRDWITSELANSQQNMVGIWIHHGIHQYNLVQSPPIFDESDAIALNQVVQTAVANNPSLKVSAFYGHDHGWGKIFTHKTFGDKFPGYLAGLAPCDYLPDMPKAGGFIIVKIYKNRIEMEPVISKFPYPN